MRMIYKHVNIIAIYNKNIIYKFNKTPQKKIFFLLIILLFLFSNFNEWFIKEYLNIFLLFITFNFLKYFNLINLCLDIYIEPIYYNKSFGTLYIRWC